MKQETNNEMDLLLRRLGQRQDVFAPESQDHLDADELNAYAENALPAKTRARYTAHLAECSRCRELVVQLSASAGVVIAEPGDKVSAPAGWRKFLASLFTPMVLRYAAPALGLIVVAVIGFVALRSNRPAEHVSQVQPAQSDSSRNVAEQVESGSPKTVAGINSMNRADATVNKEVQRKNEPQASPTPVPQSPPVDVTQSAPPAKAPVAKSESQPAATAEPAAPSPAKLDANDEKRQKNEDAVGKSTAEVKVVPKETATHDFEVSAAKKAEEPATMRARTAKNKSVVAGTATAQGAAASPGRRERSQRDDEDTAKDSVAETRSVAGREFQKRGGVWIDTAYDKSKAITTYHRDSESYRSLIADEPAIKTIADRLDGEIIVVWKGRAYRIQ
jgi:Putative zinc-finger